MGENVRATLGTVLFIGGIAIVVYAAYLYYVALPEEHAPRHVAIRAAIAVVGIVLLLLGAGSLR
jgi:hypothetical protein